MNRITLNEVQLVQLVRDVINTLLNEELSVADEVKSVSDSICKQILRGNNDFKYPIFDIGDYLIKWYPIEENGNVYLKGNGETNVKDEILTLNVIVRNGEVIEEKLYPLVFHEIEHLFQMSKLAKKGETKKSYNSLYSLAIELFNQSSSGPIKDLSRLIYICSTMEQDAVANELYAALIKNKPRNEESETKIIMSSNCFKSLEVIRDVISDMTNPTGLKSYKEAAKQFGKSTKWFLWLAKTSEIRIKRKMSNVILKARKDIAKDTTFPYINIDTVVD